MNLKLRKFLDFDIQMFAEEADNDSDEGAGVPLTDGTDNANSTKVDKVDEPIDKTKAFSARLKEKTKEIEDSYSKKFEEKLLNVAKLNGFSSWEEMEKHNRVNALQTAGIEDVDKFEETLNNLINQSPEVLKAKEIVERNKAKENETKLAEELSKINKLDPSISSLDDISKLDNCKEIIDKLNGGYSLYDAYVLANFDNIRSDVKEAGKRTAIDNINSKSHMKTATGGSGQHINIPDDVLAMYRKNLKGWTDAQIREHYEKQFKEV